MSGASTCGSGPVEAKEVFVPAPRWSGDQASPANPPELVLARTASAAEDSGTRTVETVPLSPQAVPPRRVPQESAPSAEPAGSFIGPVSVAKDLARKRRRGRGGVVVGIVGSLIAFGLLAGAAVWIVGFSQWWAEQGPGRAVVPTRIAGESSDELLVGPLPVNETASLP